MGTLYLWVEDKLLCPLVDKVCCSGIRDVLGQDRLAGEEEYIVKNCLVIIDVQRGFLTDDTDFVSRKIRQFTESIRLKVSCWI